MHIHFLDPFREGNSPVHRLDPRVKFILVVSFIFTTALTPAGAWPVYLLLLSLVLSVEVYPGWGSGMCSSGRCLRCLLSWQLSR